MQVGLVAVENVLSNAFHISILILVEFSLIEPSLLLHLLLEKFKSSLISHTLHKVNFYTFCRLCNILSIWESTLFFMVTAVAFWVISTCCSRSEGNYWSFKWFYFNSLFLSDILICNEVLMRKCISNFFSITTFHSGELSSYITWKIVLNPHGVSLFRKFAISPYLCVSVEHRLFFCCFVLGKGWCLL